MPTYDYRIDGNMFGSNFMLPSMPVMHPSIRYVLSGMFLTILAALPLQAGAAWTARVGQWEPADIDMAGPGPNIQRR